MAVPSRTRRRWLAAGVAWMITAPLAGLAAARLLGVDRYAVLAAANGATQLVYLPAYAALATGALTRRRALTAVAAGVVVAHLVWIAPELRPARALPPDAAAGTRLRLVTANIRFNSPDASALGWELAASGADLLLVQELTPWHLLTLKEAGAFDRFPYSYVDARRGSFGGGIWSRYPLSEAETWDLQDHPAIRATVDVDGTRVRVYNVHTKAPSRRRWILRWEAQLRSLARELERERPPVIMAGDFNATYGHKPFRDLVRAGLRDAHVEVGRGRARTWPRGGRIIPPLLRLDHVLVTDEVGVLGVREGRGDGSDHRPVIADLSIRPALSAEPVGRRRRS